MNGIGPANRPSERARERVSSERVSSERVSSKRVSSERVSSERASERIRPIFGDTKK